MIESVMVDTLGEYPRIGFEEQFSNPETLKLPNGTQIEVFDISPEVLKDPVPILLGPGWSEGTKSFKECLRIIHSQGRRVLTTNHPPGDWRLWSINEHEAEMRKAQSLIEIPKSKGIKTVDFIGHSEGNLNGVLAAVYEPDLIRSMVLENPSGLMGKDNLPSLIARQVRMIAANEIRKIRQPELRDALDTYFDEGSKYLRSNPVRAIREGLAISRTDILGLIDLLHKRGVKIALVLGVFDPLFPIEDIQKNLKSKSSSFDGVYTTRSDHNDFHLNPEKHTKLALQALEDLNRPR